MQNNQPRDDSFSFPGLYDKIYINKNAVKRGKSVCKKEIRTLYHHMLIKIMFGMPVMAPILVQLVLCVTSILAR